MNPQNLNFQYQINKTKQLFEEKMALILIDSYYNPCKKEENGAFFIDNIYFVVNMKILGSKLGIHSNSLNKNFRHHKIKCINRFPIGKSLNLTDQNGWKIYKHSNCLFSLKYILNGSIPITSPWDKNIKIRSNETTIQNENKSNREMMQNTIEGSVNNKDCATIKFLTKKTTNGNDFFSDEEEHYLDFL